MRRVLILLILVVIFFAIAVPLLLTRSREQITQRSVASNRGTQTRTLHGRNGPLLLGGFSTDTLEEAEKAAKDGVQVVFDYGHPPSLGDKLGQKLFSLHLKVVDGYIWNLLFNYECHRTKTVKPPPTEFDAKYNSFCSRDNDPKMSNESTLLQAVAAYLRQAKDNPLILGYWVLDDWKQWDAGSARQVLIKIRDLIQRYTPGRPAICGFGASLTSGQEPGWKDWVADNFSPQGCDEVGLYVYAPTIYTSTTSGTATVPPSVSYDWSMSAVLPAMFTSLQQRGWNIAKEPLIGIGQAFGGPTAYSGGYWTMPTAKDIETQSKSFCEHGASGLVFYAWADPVFGPKTQTPMNNSAIENGIRSGIAACKQYWGETT